MVVLNLVVMVTVKTLDKSTLTFRTEKIDKFNY